MSATTSATPPAPPRLSTTRVPRAAGLAGGLVPGRVAPCRPRCTPSTSPSGASPRSPPPWCSGCTPWRCSSPCSCSAGSPTTSAADPSSSPDCSARSSRWWSSRPPRACPSCWSPGSSRASRPAPPSVLSAPASSTSTGPAARSLNAVAPGAGTATGALLSGLVVQFLPAPTHLVYVAAIAVFAVQARRSAAHARDRDPPAGCAPLAGPRPRPAPLRAPAPSSAPHPSCSRSGPSPGSTARSARPSCTRSPARRRS